MTTIRSTFTHEMLILNGLAGGVIALDGGGRISTLNLAAEEMFGVEAYRFIGSEATSLTTLMPDFPELLYTFLSNGAVQLRAEIQGIHRHNGSRTLELRFSSLQFAEGIGAAVLILDRTTQFALEQAHEAQLVRTRKFEESA